MGRMWPRSVRTLAAACSSPSTPARRRRTAFRTPAPLTITSSRWNAADARFAVDVVLARRSKRRESSGNLGSLSHQVVTFPDIRGDIEQHRPPAVIEQFPVAPADRLLADDAPEERPFDLRDAS